MKIRRSNTPIPSEVEALLAEGPSFKRRYTIASVEVRLHATEWWPVADSDFLEQRVIRFWMNDGEHLGVGKIKFVRSDDDLASEDIAYDLDNESAGLSDLAEVLSRVENDFGRFELSEFFYGCSVALFDLVWTEPKFARNKWAEVLMTLLERWSGRGKYSAYVLKAFPLEFSEEGAPDPKRLAAMKRLYHRLLCVWDAPGEFGEDGWMLQTFIV